LSNQALTIISAVWHHPANKGERLSAVLRAIGWQLHKRLLHSPLDISFHGLRLRCYPDSTVTSAAIYFNGLADFWEMRFIQDYLRPGDAFLDIGANVGVYSLLAATRVGPSGRVDAFEPFERSAKRIEEQTALNGLDQVRVHRYAVSDHNGSADFGLAPNDATLHLRRQEESTSTANHVQCIRLDDWPGRRPYVLAKIDIEGVEPLAFRGAEEMLRESNPPVWIMEVAGYSNCYGVGTSELLDSLQRQGYDCMTYDPQARCLLPDPRPWESGRQNVLMVSRAAYAETLRRIEQLDPITQKQ
jgi:FkbM family methyltransferase